MRESSTYQAILHEGEQVALREMLVLLGTDKFGPPDARVSQRLEAIGGLTELKNLCVRTRNVSSWEELLAEAPLSHRSS